MRFGAYIGFLLWSTSLRSIVHWCGGRAAGCAHGINDFAGGTVVETASGIAPGHGMFIGRRHTLRRKICDPITCHSRCSERDPVFGWLGSMRLGRRLARPHMARAVGAFVATQIAMATAAITWMAADWVCYGKPTRSVSLAAPSPEGPSRRVRLSIRTAP